MKLFMVPLAPNPTKVTLYIAEREELGANMGVEQIVVNTLKGQHKEPEHLARNPFGTLPTLELDDGSHILESLAIIQYLEDKFPDGALLSGEPEEKARARDLERIVDLRVAVPMGAYVHSTKSPLGLPPNPEKAAESHARPADTPRLSGTASHGRRTLTPWRASLYRGFHPASLFAIPAFHRSGCAR